MFSNPYRNGSSGSGLVDQMIGKSYEVVKTIYDNLGTIKQVACSLPAIRASANNIHRSIASLDGEMAGLGQLVLVPIPSSIDEDSIMDFNVLLVGSDFGVYNPSNGHFTYRIFNNNLEVMLNSGAPTVLIGAQIRCSLSYRD